MVTGEQKDQEILFFSDTDPLPDLCLVPLWKDVDVRLKRAGFNDSVVPGGHKENIDEDYRLIINLLADNLDSNYTCLYLYVLYI